HRNDGTLSESARTRDRRLKKFRFVAGDLCGVQRALFPLTARQVKGFNKILRARSLLMWLTEEAAVLAARRELELPAFSPLQNAGGRFLRLAALEYDLRHTERDPLGMLRVCDGDLGPEAVHVDRARGSPGGARTPPEPTSMCTWSAWSAGPMARRRQAARSGSRCTTNWPGSRPAG
ncbi:MAG: hypothetical protein ACPL88_10115, partial [Bryobacteraceae bacterium]